MTARVMSALSLAFALMALPTASNSQTPMRDGRRDFDWEIGAWQTHVRVLASPLSGSNEWIELNGTTVVTPFLDGRANVAELKVSSDARRIEGVALRLYQPQSGQWSIHYANSNSGVLDKPVIGSFRDGRGEFYAEDTYQGRAIRIRFVMTPAGEDTWRFEQAFSEDGGKTWELNWIATDKRVK